MAWARGVTDTSADSAEHGGASGTRAARLIGTTTGRGIVAACVWADSGDSITLSSITCTGESNLTLIGSKYRNATVGASIQLAYLPEISAGGDKTVLATWSDTSAGRIIVASEYSGGDIAAFLDATSVGAAGNSTAPSVSITTGSGGALIFAVAASLGSQPAASSSGLVDITTTNYSWYSRAADNIDAGAAGSKTVSFTSGSAAWMVVAASFKTDSPPPSGPSIPVVMHHYRQQGQD